MMEVMLVRYTCIKCIFFLFSISTLFFANEEPLSFRLDIDQKEVVVGDTLLISIEINIASEWHLYAEKEGVVGIPLSVSWRVPKGFTISQIEWPEPIKNGALGEEYYTYDNTVIGVAELFISERFSEREAVLIANVDWGICSETLCIPGSTKLEKEIFVRIEEKSGFLWSLFALAFLGGLILNCMPCVLPVISLKLLNLLNLVNSKRSLILKHSLMFVLGVFFAFWVLTFIFLLFRHLGESVGWGFQFQEPLFVAYLALFLLLFALSFFGLFDIGLFCTGIGEKRRGVASLWGSFINGMLVTIVATPCTGPFLGPVLGLSMTLPSLHVFLILSAIALGVSFPYLLFGFFPSVLNYFPKPGPWIIKFKQVMGFCLLLTVIWLMWIYLNQVGSDSFIGLGVSFLIACLGAWVYGGLGLKKKRTRWISRIFVCLLLLISFIGIYFVTHKYSHKEIICKELNSFSTEKFKALERKRVPIFLSLTAKWCLICELNKPVLYSDEVKDLFSHYGVSFMEGDLTNKSIELTDLLHQFGREGVPAYILINTVSEEYFILPQILTVKALSEALEKL
jgi:thiol:disulfide interchange protein